MSLFKKIAVILAFFAVVAAIISAVLPSRIIRSEKSAAFEVLNTEWLKFFVTNRIVTQVAIQSSNTDLFLGDEYSVAFGVAEIAYGIDLQKIESSDVVLKDGKLILTFPSPEVFSVNIRQDSITVMTKSTILRKLGSIFAGENIESQLRVALEAEAVTFASSNGLFPSENEIYNYTRKLFQQLYPNVEVVISNANAGT